MKKILLIGTRGIPSNYGGFETCVEELTKRLSDDFEIYVYCRSQYYDRKYRSINKVNLIYLPTIKLKSLDTFFHTFISILHALIFHLKSIIMVFNFTNSLVVLLSKIIKN